MSSCQLGVLAPIPAQARALRFQLKPGAAATKVVEHLSVRLLGDEVVGLGATLVGAIGRTLGGLGDLQAPAGARVPVPSTPGALWVWLRGGDRGQLVHRTLDWSQALAEVMALEDVADMFSYLGNRDLSGYEDGTENPVGDRARQVAVVGSDAVVPSGSSFVAVQRWQHDLVHLGGLTNATRDSLIGRRASDNEEFDEAPPAAHVKRAAQESFEPQAFMLRRSMPWAEAQRQGLIFIAFGRSFAAFEAVLRRMVGIEDGIVDGLFQFTRPVDGAYYWCPPVSEGRLDLGTLSR